MLALISGDAPRSQDLRSREAAWPMLRALGRHQHPRSKKPCPSTVPPQWRDLRTSSAVIPLGVNPDDPVEFIVSMDRQ